MSANAHNIMENPQDVQAIARAFVPLLAIKPGFLNDLMRYARVELLCPGEVLFECGEQDARHCYLVSGTLKSVTPSGHTELLHAGEILSPLADEQPRAVSCKAQTDCTVLTIDSDTLDRALSWSQICEYLLSILTHNRELDEDIEWMRTVLDSNLFYKVPPVNAERIFTQMKVELVQPGDVIVREGEIGDCCYFIKEGQAQVTRFAASGAVRIAEIGEGRCFGEDALVYETVRNATVTMQSHGVLMRLAKADFKLLLNEPEVDEIAQDELAGLTETPVYIDVRTQAEYELGHLSMAANIPLNLLGLKRRLLRDDLLYIFYCDTGRRSRAASCLLGKLGFNTMNIKGGLIGQGMQYQLVNDLSYVLKDGVVVRG